MKDDHKIMLEKLMEDLKSISYIDPNEIPNIDLYMDQVTTFMDQHLERTKRYSEDKLLTKTMINNYTKNDLLPPTTKKKYSKDHLILLIFIYYLKNILSITDIQALLHPLSEMFFSEKGELSLEEIYRQIYEMQIKQSSHVVKDIYRKVDVSEEAFEEVGDKEQQEYLKNFAYACLLSYDIYTKRQMLERLIDEKFMTKKEETSSAKETKKKES